MTALMEASLCQKSRAFIFTACLSAASICAVSAEAQVHDLRCPIPGNPLALRLVLDYGARTMTVEILNGDAASSIAFDKVPATFGSESISAEVRRGNVWVSFTLNRYTGVVMEQSDRGSGPYSHTSSPCVPFQRGQRKY